jgi:beta-glucanase (GH16 family)
MTGRLAAAAAGIAAVVALVAWGLVPGGTTARGAQVASAPPPAARSAPAATAPTPAGPPAGWRLVFNGGFAGTGLRTTMWATCYPWMNSPSGCTNFGNTEYQWYLPGQDRVSGGVLHLAAERLPVTGLSASGRPRIYQCRSGMVTTYPALRFTYGYVQVVAKLPLQPGLWSGLWLAAASQHWPPEVDILEHWGTAAGISGLYLHPVSGHLLRKHVEVAALGSHWHTFGLYWTSQTLTWYIDGHMMLTTHADIPHQAMYFIADLAEYQAASSCTAQLQLRSVRVWQPA